MIAHLLFEIRTKRAAIIGWTLGMGGFVLLYVGLFPSFIEQIPSFEELLELPIYQALGLTTMGTYAGWVSSTVLNFMPVILGVYALIAGTGTLVGDEVLGTLENVAALPLARWQIVLSKYLAILVALFVIVLLTAAITLGVTAWVKTQAPINLGYLSILLATVSVYPLLAFLAAVALFLSAFLPNRAPASGLSIALLISSYLSNNLFGHFEELQDYQFLSPFHYFNASAEAFTQGPAVSDILVLTLISLLFLGLAMLSFQRRNLMVHAWFWQRPQAVQDE